jgi:hypothetical protein
MGTVATSSWIKRLGLYLHLVPMLTRNSLKPEDGEREREEKVGGSVRHYILKGEGKS